VRVYALTPFRFRRERRVNAIMAGDIVRKATILFGADTSAA